MSRCFSQILWSTYCRSTRCLGIMSKIPTPEPITSTCMPSYAQPTLQPHHFQRLRQYSSERPTQEDISRYGNDPMDEREVRKQKIALILGPAWFVFLMYLCFFREEKEGGVMEYLSQDPRFNDSLPEEVQQKARKLYGDSEKKG